MTSQNQQATLPQTQPLTATVSIFFDYDALRGQDYGPITTKFEFKAMMNGGFIVRASMKDFKFSTIKSLIKSGYFKDARSEPVSIRFYIKDGSGESVIDLNRTKEQTAIILSVNVKTKGYDESEIEMVAIDAASWYLNRGEAGGEAYKGKLSEAITQIIDRYSFGIISANVTETTDSKENRWYMMRMDPKTWIGSIMDWASAVTKTKTNFIIESDLYEIFIREQGLIPSRERGYYEAFGGKNDIRESELVIDNALSLVEAKLLTQGCSALSGLYIENVDVGEFNTQKKQLSRIPQNEGDNYYSFIKPDENIIDGNATGYTRIDSIPEVYNGGEIGLDYKEYIDGRARGLYLAMVNNLLRTRIRLRGQASYFDSKGLGIDTVYIRWMDTYEDSKYYWYTGNWLLYGFNHVMERGSWTTDLYLSRFDFDASGIKNPARPANP